MIAGLAASAMAAQQTEEEVDHIRACSRLSAMRVDQEDLTPEDTLWDDTRMSAGRLTGHVIYYGWGNYLPHWFPSSSTFEYA